MQNVIPPLNVPLYQKLKPYVYGISVILLLIIASLRRFHIDTTIDFSWLAGFHSSLNAVTALVLALAYYFIKIKKNVKLHKRLMITAIFFSCMFLLSYVIYHLTTEETKFCREESWIRTVYFILLISHIILAAVILPIILFTFLRAYTGQIKLHVQMARWAFPLWFYIAITGPILYLLLRPCF